MEIDPQRQSAQANYKLLTNLVVPRPIAWVTSLGDHGQINLAPFSFFNALGADPVLLGFSIGRYDDGRLRDTATNILRHPEFVVHMVTEEFMAAMNLSATDFPASESEVDICGLRTQSSVQVQVPRLADVQVSMECRLFKHIELGKNLLVIGEVLMFHVHDEYMAERMHIQNFYPVGRMGSPSRYCRTNQVFDVPRMSYELWLKKLEDQQHR